MVTFRNVYLCYKAELTSDFERTAELLEKQWQQNAMINPNLGQNHMNEDKSFGPDDGLY